MSAYGLGVELTSSVVRWASATGLTEVGPVNDIAPTVVAVNAVLVGGMAATASAASTPGNAVQDVVSQFVVDRLWFVGGMMLTPDDCMRALLAGCVGDASQSLGRLPESLTVSCPAMWDDDAVQRIRVIVGGLAIPSAAVAVGINVSSAAADAASRLAQRTAGSVRGDLPPMAPPAPLRPPVPAAPAAAPPPRRARRVRSRWWGWVVWSLVVLGIPLVIFLLVRAGREPAARATPATTTATTPAQTSVPVTTAPLPPLTIGFVSSGGAGSGTGAASVVATLDAATSTFPSGVFLVVQPAGDDVATTIAGLRGQGVAAVITDTTGAALDAVASAAQAASLPLCVAVASGGPAPAISGVGVVIGDEQRCPPFLALAVLSARSLTPSRLVDAVDALATDDGLRCATFEQCAAFVAADQPISFQPDGGPVLAVPDA